MRRLLLSFLVTAFSYSYYAIASPVYPYPIEIELDNGKKFKIKMWGDENKKGYETLEGYPIMLDPITDKWAYACKGWDNSITSSGVSIERPIVESLCETYPYMERELESIEMAEKEIEGMSSFRMSSIPSSKQSTFANSNTIGRRNIALILANPKGGSPTYTADDFLNLLFMGSNSMAAYYKENSYGNLELSPGFQGALGWLELPSPHEYYADWIGDLVYQAAEIADMQGFDFSEYDNNGDCIVDDLVMVHEGDGSESSPLGNKISAHKGTISWAINNGRSHFPPYITNDNCRKNPSRKLTVDDYSIQAEKLFDGKIMTVGVFAHEYGHLLGLPDLYDYDASSHGIGIWGIMGGGTWLTRERPGDRPSNLEIWSKLFLRWITPIKLDGSTRLVHLRPASLEPIGYQAFEGDPLESGEYFLIEERERIESSFDSQLPAGGVLVWHVDSNMRIQNPSYYGANNNECYPNGPSCPTSHPQLRLVQADGMYDLEKRNNTGDAGDPYPGINGNKIFSPYSIPSSSFYSNGPSGLCLTSIESDGISASFNLTFNCTETPTSFSVSASVLGNGRITSSLQGIDCGTACTTSFSENTNVVLSASPDAGFSFSGWSGACTGTASCSLTMNEDKKVTAIFTAIPINPYDLSKPFVYPFIPKNLAVVKQPFVIGWQLNMIRKNMPVRVMFAKDGSAYRVIKSAKARSAGAFDVGEFIWKPTKAQKTANGKLQICAVPSKGIAEVCSPATSITVQ